MDEIKKTLEIFKNRWLEVTLIISIDTLAEAGRFLLRQGGPFKIQPIYSLGHFAVVSILISGFMRTVYLEATRQQGPIILFKTGLYFFWRMFRFWLLYMLFFILMIVPQFLIGKYLGIVGTGSSDMLKAHLLIYRIWLITPFLVLAKLILLLPAVIIVLDCMVLESFSYLKKCRLFDAKEMLGLFVLSIAISFLGIMLPRTGEDFNTYHYFLLIVQSVISRFILLMIAVIAVRYVGSLNLVYSKPVNPKDLLKY